MSTKPPGLSTAPYPRIYKHPFLGMVNENHMLVGAARGNVWLQTRLEHFDGCGCGESSTERVGG